MANVPLPVLLVLLIVSIVCDAFIWAKAKNWYTYSYEFWAVLSSYRYTTSCTRQKASWPSVWLVSTESTYAGCKVPSTSFVSTQVGLHLFLASIVTTVPINGSNYTLFWHNWNTTGVPSCQHNITNILRNHVYGRDVYCNRVPYTQQESILNSTRYKTGLFYRTKQASPPGRAWGSGARTEKSAYHLTEEASNISVHILHILASKNNSPVGPNPRCIIKQHLNPDLNISGHFWCTWLTTAVFVWFSYEINPWGRLIKYTNNRERKSSRKKGKEKRNACQDSNPRRRIQSCTRAGTYIWTRRTI